MGSHARSVAWVTLTRLGVASVLALGVGCGDTKYDVYMQGAKIEGEAERGVCRLQYTEPSAAAPLTGDQVLECLRETQRALEYYERAASMGFQDHDFRRVHQRALERKERLESMLVMVREMERDQLIGR